MAASDQRKTRKCEELAVVKEKGHGPHGCGCPLLGNVGWDKLDESDPSECIAEDVVLEFVVNKLLPRRVPGVAYVISCE